MAVGTSTGQVNRFQLETSLLSYCFRGVCIMGNTHSSVLCVTRHWGVTVLASVDRVLRLPCSIRTLRSSASGPSDGSERFSSWSCSGATPQVSSWLWFRTAFSRVCGTEFYGKTKIWNSLDFYSTFKYIVEALRIPVDKKCAESVFPKGICPRILFFSHPALSPTSCAGSGQWDMPQRMLTSLRSMNEIASEI